MTIEDETEPDTSEISQNVSERTPLLGSTSGSSERMVEKNIGISQQTLVSSTGETTGRKLPQYAAGLASTLGALAAGMVLGWTSSSGTNGKYIAEQYGIEISEAQFARIGSLVTLGAASICIPIGLLADLIGRKTSMLLLALPFTVGWGLIIWANSVEMFYWGRFITGLSGGAFCVTAPMYTSEISENSIRGTLGSFFQLLVTVGILLAYILASMVNIKHLSMISGAVPVIFFIIFSMMPESPVYYMKKGNLEGARSSLRRLRGPDYNCEAELQILKDSMDNSQSNNVSFKSAITSKPAIRSLIIGYGLMFFQQASGVNVIVFYSSVIFEAAGSTMSPSTSTIVVGVMQVLTVLISSLIVDKLGRRALLLVSEVFMFVSLAVLGAYFHLKDNGTDVSHISWLPLLAVSVFIIVFSLGFGPIPWLMMGEIFAPQIKGIGASSAGLMNWMLAFAVTNYFSTLRDYLNTDGAFWLFSGFCAVGLIFVIFVIPETKGKSLEEIQIELGAPMPSAQPRNQTLTRI